MVFYFFVYREVAQKSRKAQVQLSNGKVLTNVKSVNGLMQQKAMPVAAVKFEGWLAQPVKEHHPMLDDETLAQTLARQKKKAEKLPTGKKSAKKHAEAHAPKKPTKFAESIASSEELSGKFSIVEPEFNPPVATVTVGVSSTAARGCMRVRTLQESLSTNIKRQELQKQGSSMGKTESTCSSSSSVHFGTVEVRQYLCCLGDNPACSSGPPISIDWKYREVGAFPVDDYDDYREPEPPHQVSYYDRVELLRTLGYSRAEIVKAEKQRKKDQALREETIYRLRFMNRDEKTETMKKMFKTVLQINAN